ncbi:YbjN domain-containing protein [Corynebacterium pacaense]|uniref:YbjN domain-containing protein n=1 Tax=Corynebacterium pacaense TaxID=1816684 RepID=UPI0009BC646B|nr:YbjN domain-containing protein [Corynebacterium pacaense]
MAEHNFRTPDTLLPRPLDLDRVEDAVDELGFQSLTTRDRLLVPHTDYRVFIYFAGETGLALNVEARMRRSLDLSEINLVSVVLNDWNAERIGPKGLVHLDDAGDVEIRFRTSVNVDEGLSTEQLLHFIQLAADTIDMAVQDTLSSFPELAVAGPNSGVLSAEQDESDLGERIAGMIIAPPLTDSENESGTMSTDPPDGESDDEDFDAVWEDGDDSWGSADDSADPHSPGQAIHPSLWPDSPEYPTEVTLNRIRSHLGDIGVVNTSGEEDFIVAWINEVFVGFFVDNGPTFLVKGHWDPGMDPTRDFVKLFMVCNRWNEQSLYTKAFCHRDEQGLQVRVEFSIPVAQGLTDDQLRHNIALSIHHILKAIDSLSTEATGTSVVDWPEQGD